MAFGNITWKLGQRNFDIRRLSSIITTVEPGFNELPRDWQNVFVITGVRFIGFFSIHFTITGLKNMDRYTEDFVI